MLDLKKLIKEANDKIKSKDFDSALSLYHKINKSYNLLSRLKKAFYRRDYEKLNNKFILYLRIKEAQLFLRNQDMDNLKLTLNSVKRLVSEVNKEKDFKEFADHVNKDYNNLLNVYLYKTSKKEFFKKIEEIRKLIEKKQIQEARELYLKIIPFYNNIVNYEDYNTRKELHNQLINLHSKLSFSEPRLIIENNKNGNYEKNKINIKKLHALLKNEDYEKAILLYNDLYGF